MTERRSGYGDSAKNDRRTQNWDTQQRIVFEFSRVSDSVFLELFRHIIDFFLRWLSWVCSERQRFWFTDQHLRNFHPSKSKTTCVHMFLLNEYIREIICVCEIVKIHSPRNSRRSHTDPLNWQSIQSHKKTTEHYITVNTVFRIFL